MPVSGTPNKQSLQHALMKLIMVNVNTKYAVAN